jgi:hypothetical protein
VSAMPHNTVGSCDWVGVLVSAERTQDVSNLYHALRLGQVTWAEYHQRLWDLVGMEYVRRIVAAARNNASDASSQDREA